jgi:CcmD family protein
MRYDVRRTRFEESRKEEPFMSPQNFNFMFYGFTVAWLIVIVYVISIALREKKLRQELDRVKRMVEENEQTRK